MKEKENTSTSSKKRLIYSVIVAICALLLIAATILTVYFVTNSGREVLEQPPVENPPVENPPIENPPVENPPVENPPEDPNKPSSGQKVAFVKPVETTTCSVEYNVIYNNTSTDKWYKHMAIDFVADAGTEVCAMADGKITKISMEEILGNYIVVEHDGGIMTVYRFVEPVSSLKEGDEVKQGQTIATVAQAYGTEYKEGTHLHLEMTLDGKPVDPADYIDVTLEEK